MKLYGENERKVVTKHPSCVAVGECPPPHRSTRNRRMWCKGQEDIPHIWEWRRCRSQVNTETRYGVTHNRIVEEPVCFGCGRVGERRRSYCRLCGEPWRYAHTEVGPGRWGNSSCANCGAPRVAHQPDPHGWRAAGTVAP